MKNKLWILSPLFSQYKQTQYLNLKLWYNRICGVMVSVIALSVVDCESEPSSSQTKDYKIGIWFSVKHAALRSRGQRLVGSESE